MPAVLPDETAARITRACLEGDGVASRLFELLWKRDLLSECSLSIRIPDTVIYRYNAPSVWYFTSVDGTIKRKTKAKLNSDHIMFEFTKRPSPSGIVAYFVSTTPDGDKNAAGQTVEAPYDSSVSTKTTVEYMDAPALKHFLTSRQRTREDGILQRFMEPKSDCNNMLRAMWSPKVCVLERRINRLKISDKRYDMYERAVTFEGPDFHSEMTPVRGPALVSKVHEIAESIVQHVAAVTGDRIQVSRLALNFKVDHKDRMWLLFASSVRLHDELSRSLQSGKLNALTLSQQGLCNTPLEVNTVLGVPDHVRRAGTVQRSRPAKLQQNCKCPTCEERVEEGNLCEVAYKVMVEYAEKQRGSRNVLPAPPDTNRLEVTALSSAQQTDDTADVTEVPEMLRRLHPRLTPAEYARHRYDVAFLYKTAEICSSCYLKFSAPQLGVRPWRDTAADPTEEAPSAAERAAEALAAAEEKEAHEEEERVRDPEKLRTRRDETRRRISLQRAAEEADEDDMWREKRREQQLWRGKSCPTLHSHRGGLEDIRVIPPAPLLESRPPRPSGAAPLWTEMRLGLKERHVPLKDQLSIDPQRSHRKLPAMRGAPYLKELQKFAYNYSDRAAHQVLPSGYMDAMSAMNKGEGKRDGNAAPTDWLMRHPALNRHGEGKAEAEARAKAVEDSDGEHSTLASLVGRPLLLEGALEEEDEEVINQDMGPLRATVASMWGSKWPNSRANSRASTTPTTRPPSRGDTAHPSTQPSTRPSSRPVSRLQSASGSSRFHPGSFAFSVASSQDNVLRQSRPSSSPQLFAGVGERPQTPERGPDFGLAARRLSRPSSSPLLRPESRSPPRRPGSSSSSSSAAQL